MKKNNYGINSFLILFLLMAQLLCSQESGSYKWSIAPVTGLKTIKSLVIYDFGLQIAYSFNSSQRLRLEGGYRTSAPNLIQNWGSRETNMKSNINSVTSGLSYEWFPMVSFGSDSKILKQIKVFTGVSYLTNPVYAFDVSLTEAVSWGAITFTPEEVGSVATTITTNKTQPFIGLGYDTFNLGKKLSFGVNGGMLYQGKPQVTMVATNMLKPTETQAERFESNLQVYQFSPFVQLFLQFNLDKSQNKDHEKNNLK